MRALILAAGVGNRLYGDDRKQPPKALLRFDGESLLERNVKFLVELGVESLTIVVGYRKDEVVSEAVRHAPPGFVEVVENPMYRGGPIISLWRASDTLRSGSSVLLMDADVLYARELLERVALSRHGNVLLFDRAVDDGEDPVRVCIRDGIPVEFGKRIIGTFDEVGEWPGFMRMTPEIAALLADACDAYIDDGRLDVAYELAIRDVMIGQTSGTFAIEDVSGIPWIEIDFPEDLKRATDEILPLIRKPSIVAIDASVRTGKTSR